MTAITEQRHARQLAARITAYWAEQGAKVQTRVIPIFAPGAGERPITYGVRSDMLNGLPRVAVPVKH